MRRMKRRMKVVQQCCQYQRRAEEKPQRLNVKERIGGTNIYTPIHYLLEPLPTYLVQAGSSLSAQERREPFDAGTVP